MGAIRALKRLKRDIDFWWFYKNFYKKFRFYTSEDSKELNESYKIRYEVYCREYKYIEPEKEKGELEFDEWDDHSVHFFIRNRDERIAATVRLILNSDKDFPIEKHFDFDIETASFDKKKMAEISRLIVTRKYRKHHLMFVLIKGMYLFVKKKNITNVYSVMDDKLYPLLTKIGIPFRKIGQPSLYQGFTYPCVLNIKELEEFIKTNNRQLYKYITDGFINFDKDNGSYTLS